MLIFIVEDDPFYAELLKYHLSLNPDDEVQLFDSGHDCLQNLYKEPAIICLDYSLPDMSGEDVLKKIKASYPHVQVIIISAQDNIKTAVDLLKKGATDYIVKDEDTKETLWKTINHIRKQVGMQRQIDNLQLEVGKKYSLQSAFIGQSPAMQKVYGLLEKASSSKITVSITGETGTGKEVAAKTIHYNSPRRNRPFVPVNLGAIPPELLESELFGYEKGAFTGATARRIGLFEEAHTGTIFLDEIAELPLNLQPKLLRTLQELEIRRIGGNINVPIDTRIIVATHKNLANEVQQGNFREDLYYRLLGLTLEMPPLRERGGDIILLARFFTDAFCQDNNLEPKNLSANTQQQLMQYSWPGNVRELKALVELAAIMSNSETIEPEHLQFNTSSSLQHALAQEMTLEEYNQLIIKHYLAKNSGNVVLTAQKLGIGKSTLYRYIQENKV